MVSNIVDPDELLRQHMSELGKRSSERRKQRANDVDDLVEVVRNLVHDVRELADQVRAGRQDAA